MTEPISGAAGNTPASPEAIAVPVAPAAPATGTNVGDPEWLPKRIAQAKANAEADLLKSIGVSNADEAKRIAADYKAKIEAEKGAETKAAELRTQLEAEAAKSGGLLSAVREYAARMTAALTPEQRAAVDALAGDDPEKQIKTVTALQATWTAKETADAAAAKSAAVAKAAITNTAPVGSAPSGAAPASPDARASYEATRDENPFAGARYGLLHPSVYNPK